ncbi:MULTISPECIES: hypothetical protein [unclassified Acinetobacter calcoaceticus/baumannii complex]|uniref:hypothetical protein n=1 Tax=unclassified Acinetobacter calcoaceticus/baumannii complex TaxID=2881046 RepID=UPI0004F56B82|nr:MULTISPECIES: hypothetical protein [unclassified Acinetobacter calcoaceticus/baumannii complex]
MKKFLVCAAAIFTLSLSAFAVYTPAGSVVVDPDSPYHNHPGDFCPPGQAKKGRC